MLELLEPNNWLLAIVAAGAVVSGICWVILEAMKRFFLACCEDEEEIDFESVERGEHE